MTLSELQNTLKTEPYDISKLLPVTIEQKRPSKSTLWSNVVSGGIVFGFGIFIIVGLIGLSFIDPSREPRFTLVMFCILFIPLSLLLLWVGYKSLKDQLSVLKRHPTLLEYSPLFIIGLEGLTMFDPHRTLSVINVPYTDIERIIVNANRKSFVSQLIFKCSTEDISIERHTNNIYILDNGKRELTDVRTLAEFIKFIRTRVLENS